MDLVEFDFTVQHHPGRQNMVADQLLRLAWATVQPLHALSAMQLEDSKCSEILRRLPNEETLQDFILVENIRYHWSRLEHT